MQDKIVVDIGRYAMKRKGDIQPFQLFYLFKILLRTRTIMWP
jgi:hypothetical protein